MVGCQIPRSFALKQVATKLLLDHRREATPTRCLPRFRTPKT